MGQRGQVTALAAISLTAIVAIAAFVIDVGSWYRIDRQAQAAADAGATAAANDLPANPSQASTDATTYVNKNISGATTTVVTPYNSQSDEVQVTVQASAPTYFAKIFGISSVNVTAKAAAKRSYTNGRWAVYAHDTTCGDQSISVPGGNVVVNGSLRSNGDLKVSGVNFTVNGPGTYGGPNNCSWQQSGGNPSFNGSPTPVQDPTNVDWPEPWNYATIPCNFNSTGSVTLGSAGQALEARSASESRTFATTLSGDDRSVSPLTMRRRGFPG